MTDTVTLDEAMRLLESRITAEWINFCRDVAADAKSRAPRGNGRLRDSIGCEIARSEDAVTGVVGTSAPYAVYVHEGTGRFHPHGRRTRWVYPVERDGRVRFYSTVGQPAVPFLRAAVENARARLRTAGGIGTEGGGRLV